LRGVFDRTLLDALAGEGALVALTRFAPADIDGQRNDIRIVDVRSSTEWKEGHIPGALHLPLADLPAAMSRIPPGPTVVHCEGGTRSVVAASALRAAGHEVADLEGGISAWRRAGLPVVTDRDDGARGR
jgi:rhodanese-related sulfurtransferase